MSYQLKVIKDYPIGFWPLDESLGTNAADISGCGNNATYVGSPASNILPLASFQISLASDSRAPYLSHLFSGAFFPRWSNRFAEIDQELYPSFSYRSRQRSNCPQQERQQYVKNGSSKLAFGESIAQ